MASKDSSTTRPGIQRLDSRSKNTEPTAEEGERSKPCQTEAAAPGRPINRRRVPTDEGQKSDDSFDYEYQTTESFTFDLSAYDASDPDRNKIPDGPVTQRFKKLMASFSMIEKGEGLEKLDKQLMYFYHHYVETLMAIKEDDLFKTNKHNPESEVCKCMAEFYTRVVRIFRFRSEIFMKRGNFMQCWDHLQTALLCYYNWQGDMEMSHLKGSKAAVLSEMTMLAGDNLLCMHELERKARVLDEDYDWLDLCENISDLEPNQVWKAHRCFHLEGTTCGHGNHYGSDLCPLKEFKDDTIIQTRTADAHHLQIPEVAGSFPRCPYDNGGYRFMFLDLCMTKHYKKTSWGTPHQGTPHRLVFQEAGTTGDPIISYALKPECLDQPLHFVAAYYEASVLTWSTLSVEQRTNLKGTLPELHLLNDDDPERLLKDKLGVVHMIMAEHQKLIAEECTPRYIEKKVLYLKRATKSSDFAVYYFEATGSAHLEEAKTIRRLVFRNVWECLRNMARDRRSMVIAASSSLREEFHQIYLNDVTDWGRVSDMETTSDTDPYLKLIRVVAVESFMMDTFLPPQSRSFLAGRKPLQTGADSLYFRACELSHLPKAKTKLESIEAVMKTHETLVVHYHTILDISDNEKMSKPTCGWAVLAKMLYDHLMGCVRLRQTHGQYRKALTSFLYHLTQLQYSLGPRILPKKKGDPDTSGWTSTTDDALSLLICVYTRVIVSREFCLVLRGALGLFMEAKSLTDADKEEMVTLCSVWQQMVLAMIKLCGRSSQLCHSRNCPGSINTNPEAFKCYANDMLKIKSLYLDTLKLSLVPDPMTIFKVTVELAETAKFYSEQCYLPGIGS